MTLATWNARPRNHFPNWVDEFFNSGIMNHKSVHQPGVNVLEKEYAFALEIASPGMKKEDFTLEMEDGSLVVTAEVKHQEEEKEDGKFIRREFTSQSFERRFLLPEDIDADKISARYEDGILKVDLPKQEPVMPKKKLIEIG